MPAQKLPVPAAPTTTSPAKGTSFPDGTTYKNKQRQERPTIHLHKTPPNTKEKHFGPTNNNRGHDQPAVPTTVFGPTLLSSLGACAGRAFLTSLFTKLAINMMTVPLTVTFTVTYKLSPARNLVATVITKFLVSLFDKDGCRVNNPAKTFIVVVVNILRRCRTSNLLIYALVTNLFLVVFKFYHVKTLVHFVPFPIAAKFASNVTIMVFSARVGSVFNLAVARGVPKRFVRG